MYSRIKKIEYSIIKSIKRLFFFSATETQEKFADMAEIVAEILQGSLSTSQWSQLEQDRLELDIESKRNNKARLEKNKAAIEAQIRETKIEVDEWRGKGFFLKLQF